MAIGQADETSLEPVVILGLLNSMAVIVAGTETILSNWDSMCADGDSARLLLDRISAHAQVVTDALEVAARGIPPSVLEAMAKPE
jgi:hypothetical protein